MQKKRVLVLKSVAYYITRSTTSPLLEDYEVQYLYAIDLINELKTDPSLLMTVQEEEIKQRDLEERLIQKVEIFKPQILLVHTGIVFSVLPVPIISALYSLKKQMPSLRIGIQGGSTRIMQILDRLYTEIPDDTLRVVLESDVFEDNSEIQFLLSELL